MFLNIPHLHAASDFRSLSTFFYPPPTCKKTSAVLAEIKKINKILSNF